MRARLLALANNIMTGLRVSAAFQLPRAFVFVGLLSAAFSLTACSIDVAVQKLSNKDDRPVISTLDASVAENTGGSIVVNLNKAANKTIVIPYTVVAGTAGAGDYALASGNLTIPAGQVMVALPLSINNDVFYEGVEGFAVDFNLPSTVRLAAASSATSNVTILDDETIPEINFAGASDSVAEQVAGGTKSVFVALSNAAEAPVTVNYAVTSGSATGGGTDYTLATGVLTFASGDISESLTVAINNDTIYEGDENLVITLSAPSSNAVLGPTVVHDLTITDNELQPQMQFALGASTIDEDVVGGTHYVVVNLDHASATAITVNYAAAGGTAVGAGTDYTLADGVLTFPALSTSRTLAIVIVDDALSELSETFNITLSSAVGATITGTNPHVVTITDDDAVPFTWLGTAGDNKWSTAGNWAGGVIPGASDVAIFDDSCSGVNCNVSIDQIVSVAGLSLKSNFTGTITQGAFAVAAGASGLVIHGGAYVGHATSGLTLTGPFELTGGALTLAGAAFQVSGDITISGGTYTQGTSLLTLNGMGNSTYTVGAAVFGDVRVAKSNADSVIVGTWQVNGDLTLDSTTTALSGGAIEVSKDLNIQSSKTTGLIKLVGGNAQTITGTLGASVGSLEINKSSNTVNLSGVIDIDWGFTHTAGTVSPGTSTVRLVGLGNGQISQVGAGLTFYNLNLEKPASPGLNVVLTGNVVVTNDLTINNLSNNEVLGPGYLTVAGDVTLTNNSGGSAEIRLNGTGVQTITQGTGTWPAANIRVNKSTGRVVQASHVSLGATPDIIFDQAGVWDMAGFNLTADILNGSAGTGTFYKSCGVLTKNSVVPNIVEVNDTFGATLSVANAADVMENDLTNVIQNFVVTISPANCAAVTFDYVTTAATATDPDDFTGHLSTTATVAAGVGSYTIPVTTKFDDLYEINEYYTLTVSNVPTSIAVGTLVAQGTILDDDSAQIPTISVADLNVTEGNPAQFVVSLSNPSGLPVVFDWASSNGSATTGAGDYTAVSGVSVTIAAGQTAVTLPNINTAIDVADPGESFNLTLSNVTNVAGIGNDLSAQAYLFEVGVVALYRSVGPNKTTALATGAGNNLTITAGVANFVSALPNNVGVGDVIQYDKNADSVIDVNDELLFITGRTDSTHYSVQTKSGGVPANMAVADTDWTICRAYVGLNDIDTGTENTACLDDDLENFDTWTNGKNIVAANEQFNFALYADAEVNYGAVSTSFSSGTWVTDSTHYLKYYTPTLTTEVGVSQRHNGTWSGGGFTVRLNYGSGVGANYTRLEGLRIDKYMANGDPAVTLVGSPITLAHNLIKYSGPTNGPSLDEPRGLMPFNSNQTLYAYNNIFSDFYNVSGGTPQGMAFRWGYGGIGYFYNNTIVDTYMAFYPYSGSAITLKNNIVQGATVFADTSTGTIDPSSDYNLSNTASASGGVNDVVSASVNFINAASDDFRLHINDVSARDTGVNLSSDPNLAFTYDVEGSARLANSWDRGASESAAVIYRSVGPANTTALASGGGTNAMSISGQTVTFGTGVPDNIGVGDVIQYQEGAFWYLAFVSGRSNNVSFVARTARGDIPVATTGNTGWSIYRAYTGVYQSVQFNENSGILAGVRDFDNFTSRSLIGSNEKWKVAFYADAVDNSLNAMGILNVSHLHTADPVRQLTWFTPVNANEVGASQRHDGSMNGPGFTLLHDSYAGIRVYTAYMHVDGLRVRKPYVVGTNEGAIGTMGGGGFLTVSNSIFKNEGDITVPAGWSGCAVGDGSGYNYTLYVYNNIFMGWKNGSGNGAAIIGGGDVFAYNNTSVNSDVFAKSSQKLYAKNNIVQGSVGTPFSSTSIDGSSNYNVVNTATATGGANDKVSQTVVFVDATNNDYRLAYNDTAAKASGMDLSADGIIAITKDIQGLSRTLPWDVGASNFVIPSAPFNILGVRGGTDVSDDDKLGDGAIATITWEPVAGEEAFRVGIYENDGTTIKCALTTIAADSTSHVFTGCTLTEGATYKAYVASANASASMQLPATNSLFSFTVDGAPPTAFTIAGIRGGADVTDDGLLMAGVNAVVNWADATGETSYDVTIYENDGTTVKCVTQNVAANTTTYNFSACNLTQGKLYKAEVIANDFFARTTGATNNQYQFLVTPDMSIADVTVAEDVAGGNVGVVVSLNVPSDQTAIFNWATSDGTADRVADAFFDDYTASSGLVTIPAGDTSVTLQVPILNETIDEPNQYFTVTLSSLVRARPLDLVAQVTITDEDIPSTLTIDDRTGVEAASQIYTLALNQYSEHVITVNYATANGSGSAGTDYTGVSGAQTLAVRTTANTLTVVPIDNVVPCQPDRTYTLDLTVPVNVTINDASGAGTIKEDDPVNVILTSVAATQEGGSVNLVATEGQFCPIDIVVNYTTFPNTATEDVDYVKQTGTLTIPAANVSSGFEITTSEDALPEAEESFFVSLQTAGLVAATNQSITNIKIVDDDVGLRVQQIATGRYHSCGLLSDGRMKCWGHSSAGELGQPPPHVGDEANELGDNLTITNFGAGKSVVAAAVGGLSGCAIMNDGKVKCWGDNLNCQLTHGTTSNNTYADSPAEVGDAWPNSQVSLTQNATQIAGSDYQFCTIMADGTVKCWGDNAYGNLGLGHVSDIGCSNASTASQQSPINFGTGRTAKAISTNYWHTCVIMDNDLVKCWGRNSSGQLGIGNINTIGDNFSELGDNMLVADIGPGRTAKKVATGFETTCVITDQDKVRCWGDGAYGVLGSGGVTDRGDGPGEMGAALTDLDFGAGYTVKDITAGAQHNCVILNDNTVKCWGRNSFGQLGIGTSLGMGDGINEMGASLPLVNLGTGRTAKKIQAFNDHTCAILDNDTVKCWGDNTFGQLGYGHTNHLGDNPGEMGDALPAVPLPTGRYAIDFAKGPGTDATCVILDNNSMACWGNALNGRLANGNSYIGDSPSEQGNNMKAVSLGTGRKAKYIAAADTETCAILDNDTLKCWGDNANAELGLGATGNRGDNLGELGDALPAINLGTGKTALAVDMGGAHVCALLNDFTVKCWGEANHARTGRLPASDVGDVPGEMGDGLPIVNIGGVGALKIAAGMEHTCVVLGDTNMKCWGNGAYGSLSNGSNVVIGDSALEMGANLPIVMFGAGEKVKYASGGRRSNCAATYNNNMRCVGYNEYGELGRGSNSTTSFLGDAPGEENASFMNIGSFVPKGLSSSSTGYFNCALFDAGDVRCWGQGASGQLGQGSTSNIGHIGGSLVGTTPKINLGTGRTALKISAGVNHACALLDTGEVKCWGENWFGQTGSLVVGNIGDQGGEMGDNLAVVDLIGTGAGTPGDFNVTGITGGSDSTADGYLNNPARVPTVNWSASAGATSYDVTVYQNDGTTVMCPTQTTAGTSYTFAGCTLTEGVQYFVAVAATDGVNSRWALNALFLFTVDTIGPDAFNILGVTGGQDVTPDATLNDTWYATLVWQQVDNAVSYKVQIYENDGVTNKCSEVSLGSTSSHNFSTCALTNGLSYKAKVISFDVGNNPLPATNSLFTFTVNDTFGPAPFNILGVTGSSDTTVDATLSSGSWPIVNWANSIGATSYDVTVYENDGTTVKCATVNVLSPLLVARFPGCELSDLTTYKVDIKAKDDTAQTTAANSLYSFTVNNNGVGAFDITGITGGEDVTIDEWLRDGPTPSVNFMLAAGATSYEVTIYENDGTTVKCALATGATSPVLMPSTCRLNTLTQYKAKAVAKNGGTSVDTFSGMYSFSLPAYPNLIMKNRPRVVEGNDLVFEVELSSTYTFPVKVEYFTWMNTADRDRDYPETIKTLTIPAGQLRNSFRIPTIDDQVSEVTESVIVGLRLPQNVNLNGESFGFGQIDDNETTIGVAKVATNGSASCALLSNGTVRCWGNPYYGQIGYPYGLIGSESEQMGDNLVAVPVGAGRTPIKVASGIEGTCVLLDNGRVKCWGDNVNGIQLPAPTLASGMIGATYQEATQAPEAPLGVGLIATDITAGVRFYCVKFTNNKIKCWGENANGQLGYGDVIASRGGNNYYMGDNLPFVDLGTGRTVKQIVTGGAHSCAILDDDSVKCWGQNTYGQLGLGNNIHRGDNPNEMGDNLPTVNLGAGRYAKKLTAGEWHTCAILDNDLVKCWGRGDYAALGQGAAVHRGDGATEMGDNLLYTDLGTGRTAKDIDAGISHTCVILDNDKVRCWGDNNYGELGIGHSISMGDGAGEMGDNLPTVDLGAGRTAKKLGVNYEHSCAILDDDTVKCWGYNGWGTLGQGHNNDISNPGVISSINLGTGRTAKNLLNNTSNSAVMCAIRDDDSLVCWGYGLDGRLGNGKVFVGDEPGEMGTNLVTHTFGGRKVVDIQPGNYAFCVLFEDQTTTCWGYANNGSLGIGTATRGYQRSHLTSQLIIHGWSLKVLKMSVGIYGGCALFEDFTTRCWGENTNGQLGYGSVTNIDPVSGAGAHNLGTGFYAIDIATSGRHACAVSNELNTKCWGRNDYGQLGLGNAVHRGDNSGEMGDNLPVVSLGTDLRIVQISAQDYATCALFNDNRVKCWGYGYDGQLVSGNTLDIGSAAGQMGDSLPYAKLAFNPRRISDVMGQSAGYFSDLGVKVFGGASSSVAGQGWDTGSYGFGNAGGEVNSSARFIDLGVTEKITHLSVGGGAACATLEDGKVKCWGSNGSSELGHQRLVGAAGDEAWDMGAYLPYTDVLGNENSLTPGPFRISGVSGAGDVTADEWLGHNVATVNWTASAGATQYKVKVLNQSGSSIICAEQTTVATAYTFTGCTLNNGTTYVAHVEAWDGSSNVRVGINAPYYFTVDTAAPTAFSISGVTGGADVLADINLTDGSTVTVSWLPSSGHTQYRVAIYENDGVTIKCALQTVGAESISLTFSGCALANLTSYKAFVEARDALGVSTAATNSLFTFTVNDASVPAAFVINGVTGGTDVTVDASLTNGSYARIHWADTTGEDGYDVTIYQNDGVTVQCATRTVAADVTSLLFDSCDLTLGSTYRVNVVAKDTISPTQATNALYAFTVAGTGPGAFMITGVQGGTDVTADAFLMDGNIARIDWGVSATATSYDITVYLGDGTTVKCALVNTASTFNVFTNCPLVSGVNYQVRVIAKQGANTIEATNSPYLFSLPVMPTLSMDSPVANENASMVFTATLSNAYGKDSVFSWATVNREAWIGQDFTYQSGSVTITAGNTSATIAVNLINDTLSEPNERLMLRVWNNQNVSLTKDSFGIGTITDNDVGKDPVIVGLTDGATCVMDSAGEIRCFGQEFEGRTGLNGRDIGDQPGEMGDNLPKINLGTGRTAKFIASGETNKCAILDNNLVKCWGWNGWGVLGQGDTINRGDHQNDYGDALPYVPLGTGRTAKAVGVGYRYACAHIDNNTVKCWGAGASGKTGRGGTATVGAAANQMGDFLSAVDVGTGRTVKQMSVGYEHVCVVLDNDTLKCWGRNDYGQLGYGDINPRGDVGGEMGDSLPVVDVGTGRTVKKVTAGYYSTCAILDNNDLKCWGYNNYGGLGYGNTAHRGDGISEMGDLLPVVDLGTGRYATDVVFSSNSTCAILDDATVKCWGRNSVGQLGYGHVSDLGDNANEMGDRLPTVNLGTGRMAVALTSTAGFGTASFCAHLDNNQLKCWGNNLSGQLGLGSTVAIGDTPEEMGDALQPVNLGAGLWATKVDVMGGTSGTPCVILNDSSVKCWGYNDYHLTSVNYFIGDAPGEMGALLNKIDLGSGGLKFLSFANSGYHNCAVTSDGLVRCWGGNYYGEHGIGNSNYRGDNPFELGDNWAKAELDQTYTALKTVNGNFSSCALLNDLKVKCWGRNHVGQLGLGDTNSRGDTATNVGFRMEYIDFGRDVFPVDIYTGAYHGCALLNDGRIKCWGSALEGKLGQGNLFTRGDNSGEMGDNLAYIDVGTGRTVINMTLHADNTCAHLDNNTMKCWGNGASGIPGQGSTTDRGDTANEMGDFLPAINLGTGRTVKMLAHGTGSTNSQHMCAVLDDDSIKCWGVNTYGQLGLGGTATRGTAANQMGDFLPTVSLGTGRSARAVFVGSFSTCAILDNGSLKCWGYNQRAELGLGDYSDRGDAGGEMGDSLPAVDLGY